MNIKELSGYSLDENTTCIQVSGQDSETFLQGQFSNDITHVTESTYQYSSYSTNQGKVISIFRIIREKQSYLLLVNKNIAEYFIERFTRQGIITTSVLTTYFLTKKNSSVMLYYISLPTREKMILLFLRLSG